MHKNLFNSEGAYLQALETREHYTGYTIDSKKAVILDDAFKITRDNHDGYLIEYFIADTGLFFQSAGYKTDQSAHNDKHQRDSRSNFRKYFSLIANEKRPAIRIVFQMTHKMHIKNMSIARVSFENIQQMNDRLYRRFAENHLEEYELHKECDQKIRTRYMKPNQQCVNFDSPIESLSTLVNAQLTQYCNNRNLPIIHQSYAIELKDLKGLFYSLEAAKQEALKRKIIPHQSQFIEGKTYFINSRKKLSPYPIESTTTKAQHYAHFTSPMGTIFDAINVNILCAHLDNKPIPYTVQELDNLIHAINKNKKRIQSSNGQNKRGNKTWPKTKKHGRR